MPASTSPGAVKNGRYRGTLSAVFVLLPMLLLALLLLPEAMAFAESSTIEIEPPSEADSHHPSAAHDGQTGSGSGVSATDANSSDTQASNDDSDDDDDDDDEEVAGKSSSVPRASAGADSSIAGSDKGSNSALHDDADDDDDDDDDSDTDIVRAAAAKDG